MLRPRILHLVASAILAIPLTGTGFPQETRRPNPPATPQIEVCFVLDTTGSMGGLIEGAKVKIWSIANQLIAAKPTPKLRIALVAYRDRGDDYVTRVFDLTEDIDAVYANLQKFAAGGGGDEAESVNQALHEAVTKIAWSPDRDVLKIVFLVGDSPPHMDYRDDVKYPDVCQLAMQKDLIINTVQCGGNSHTTPIWQEIARRAEGQFVAISQTGDMQVVSTPVDKDLAELNVALGTTLVPYGHAEQRRFVVAKQAAAEAALAPAAADRLAYNVALGRGVQGTGDLVDDLKDGKVTLTSLQKEELPAAMQGMTAAQQRDFLQQKADERQQLQARVSELLKKRQAFIDAELQKQLQAGKGNAFDLQVARLLRDQARRKGIAYADVMPQSGPAGEGR
jgi:Mg-chelatase subunit ChlD